jgi:hypothetical protein
MFDEMMTGATLRRGIAMQNGDKKKKRAVQTEG